MSIKCMNLAIEIDGESVVMPDGRIGLTPTKKFILVLLGNYADEKDECFPSHKHLAKRVGLKDSKSVQKTIKQFEQLGWLKIKHRKKENGSYTSNLYTLTLPNPYHTPTPTETPSLTARETPNTKEDKKTNTENVKMQFNHFWLTYPRKVGKQSALKVFSKFDTKTIDKIIYAVELFSLEAKDKDEKFIPHATTWLNQERFLDYFDDDGAPLKTLKSSSSSNLNNLAG